MKSINQLLNAAFVLILCAGLFAHADEISDAQQFRQIFLNEVRTLNPKAAPENIDALHFTPDAAVLQTLRANSLDEALTSIRASIVSLLNTTKAASLPAAPAARPRNVR